MVQLENFDCTIDVDGVALREYTDPGDAGEREGRIPTAIVYIQSEEGKPFSIKFSALDDVPEANAVSWSLDLDGNEIDGSWICDVQKGNNVHCNEYRDAYGRWLKQDFLFAKLDVMEDGPERNDNKDTSSLGEITIRVYRFQVIGPPSSPNSDEYYEKAHTVKSVHEKQLKGRDIMHTVG
jgi:hypothetical protein